MLWFFAYVMATIALNLWKVGPLPLRSLLGVALLTFIFLVNQKAFMRSWRLCSGVNIMVLAVGAVGTIVSVLNGLSTGALLQNIAEIYIQTIINLLLAVAVIYVIGGRATMVCIVLPVAITAGVSIMQYAGIEASWTIRETLGRLQNEDFSVFFTKRRPMGLSYSPIVLATQLCTAFAAYGIYRRLCLGIGRLDPMIICACFGLVIVSIAAGNRSPILGAALFLVVHGMIKRPMLALPLALILGPIAFPVLDFLQGVLSDAGSRIAEVDDASAAGRITLVYYGLRLLFAQPWGYGLGFDPTVYWNQYWSEVANMPNPEVIVRYPLHNYVLSMLNFYGIWLLAFLPKFLQYSQASRRVLIFFIPYGVHILFHNAGPLWNDTFVWLVIALGMTEMRPSKEERDVTQGAAAGSPGSQRKWARAPSSD